jgi:RNA polymerase sigma-70 factor, ECF subfamily
MNEREAIARLQGGDIAGLEVLVRLYQERALHVAYLTTRDYAAAEDVVQTAFLRAYDKIAQFDGSRPFGPWFLRSVVNAALTVAVRGRKFELQPTDDTVFDRQISPEPELYARLEAAETREEILQLIGQLAPAQRAVVVLRYYLDLSDTEIAERLDCPPGTVRRRLFDARQRMKFLLGAKEESVKEKVR